MTLPIKDKPPSLLLYEIASGAVHPVQGCTCVRHFKYLGHAVPADAASSPSTLRRVALSSTEAICPRMQNNLILTDIIAKLGLLDYYE